MIKKAISTLIAKRKALESLSVYLTTSFLAKSLSFLLLPWFTNYLSPSDFGVINLFSGGITFLTPLISMGVIYNLSIEYYKVKHADNVQKIYHGLILGMLISILISLLIVIFSSQLAHGFKIPLLFIYYLPFIAFLNFLFELLLLIYRLNEKPYLFAFLVLSKLMIELGASFYLIKYLHQGVKGRIDGIILSFLLTIVFILIYIIKQRKIRFHINHTIFKEDLKYGFVGIISQTSVFVLFSADRFVLSYFEGNENTGIYSVGATFAFILIVVISACLNYFTPKFYKCLSEKNTNLFIQNFKYYLLIILIGGILIGIITPFIFNNFINPKFQNGLNVFFILLFGILLWAFSSLFLNLMWFFKLKRKIVFLSIIIICLHLIISILATLKWSIIGTAIAIVISNLIIIFIYYWSIKKSLNDLKT